MSEKDHLGLREEEIRNRKDASGTANLMTMMSDGGIDPAALAASEDGRIIDERLSLMGMPEGSEEGRQYWKNYEKGLDKTIHGEGLDKWAVYVPLAAEKDPLRRFPLVFLCHGAHNPIQLTESYGVIQLAAREELIVIAPENENWESISEKYEFAKKNLPVDLSRVYSIGYSFGGFMSSRNVLAHPEIFAGAGMGGMLFAGKVREHELDGQTYTAYELTEEMLRKDEQLEVPLALFMGENEMLRLLPLWREPVGETATGVIPLHSDEKKASFNNFRRVSGCGPATFLAEGEDASETEKRIGARFERTEIREYHGRHYYIGDSVCPDGETLFRTIACEGMVHWPSSMFAELVWEHLKKYGRDVESGRLIRF